MRPPGSRPSPGSTSSSVARSELALWSTLVVSRDFAGAEQRVSPGGASETRTRDPLLAKQVLFQLSYSPFGRCRPASVGLWGLVRTRVPNRARASTGTRRMAHQAAQTHRYGTDPARQPIVPGGTPTSAITPSVRGANRTIRALRLLDGKSELGGLMPFAGWTYAGAQPTRAGIKPWTSREAWRSAHRPRRPAQGARARPPPLPRRGRLLVP